MWGFKGSCKIGMTRVMLGLSRILLMGINGDLGFGFGDCC